MVEGSARQLRLSGHVSPATNNRMELTAVLEGLKAIRADDAIIKIYTDSAYVSNGCKDWRHRWKINGWRKSNKKPVENADLWIELDALLECHSVDLQWIKGHSGHLQNDLADRLAVAAARGQTVRQYRKVGDYDFCRVSSISSREAAK